MIVLPTRLIKTISLFLLCMFFSIIIYDETFATERGWFADGSTTSRGGGGGGGGSLKCVSDTPTTSSLGYSWDPFPDGKYVNDFGTYLAQKPCAGLSWIFYRATTITNSVTVFPQSNQADLEPKNSADSDGVNALIPSQCSYDPITGMQKSGVEYGFWHYGINTYQSAGVYTGNYEPWKRQIMAANNEDPLVTGHTSTIAYGSGAFGSSVYDWNRIPYSEHGITSSSLDQTIGVYVADRYETDVDKVLKYYNQAQTAAGATTTGLDGAWGFCWSSDMGEPDAEYFAGSYVVNNDNSEVLAATSITPDLEVLTAPNVITANMGQDVKIKFGHNPFASVTTSLEDRTNINWRLSRYARYTSADGITSLLSNGFTDTNYFDVTSNGTELTTNTTNSPSAATMMNVYDSNNDGQADYYTTNAAGEDYKLEELSFKFKKPGSYLLCETFAVNDLSGIAMMGSSQIASGKPMSGVCVVVKVNGAEYAGISSVALSATDGGATYTTEGQNGINLVATNDGRGKLIGNVANPIIAMKNDGYVLNDSVIVSFGHNSFVNAKISPVTRQVVKTVIIDGAEYCITNGGEGALTDGCLVKEDIDSYYTVTGSAHSTGTYYDQWGGVTNAEFPDGVQYEKDPTWWYLQARADTGDDGKRYMLFDKMSFKFLKAGEYEFCEAMTIAGNSLTKVCAKVTVGDVQKYAGLSQVGVLDKPIPTTTWGELMNMAGEAWGKSGDGMMPNHPCADGEQEDSACRTVFMALDATKEVPVGFAHNGFSNKTDQTDIWRSVEKTVKIVLANGTEVVGNLGDGWSDMRYARTNFADNYLEFVDGDTSDFKDKQGKVLGANTAEKYEKNGETWYYVESRSLYGGTSYYMLADLFKVKFKAAGEYTLCETLKVGVESEDLTRVCAKITVGEAEYAGLSNVSFPEEDNNYYVMPEPTSQTAAGAKLGGNWESPLPSKNEYLVEDDNKNSAVLAFSHNGLVNMETGQGYQKIGRMVTVAVDGNVVGTHDGMNNANVVDGYYKIERVDDISGMKSSIKANETFAKSSEQLGNATTFMSGSTTVGPTKYNEKWYYLYPRYYQSGENWYSFRDEYKITFVRGGKYTFCETLTVGASADKNTELNKVCAEITVGAPEFAAMGEVKITTLEEDWQPSFYGVPTPILNRIDNGGIATNEPVSEKTTLIADGYNKYWVGDEAEISFTHDTFSKAEVDSNNRVKRGVIKTVKIDDEPEVPLESLIGNSVKLKLSMTRGDSGQFGDTGYTDGSKFGSTDWLYLIPRSYTESGQRYMTGDIIDVVFKRMGIYTFCETSSVKDGEILKICARVEVGNNQVYYGESVVAVDSTREDTGIVRDGVVEKTITNEAKVGDAFNMQFYHDAFTQRPVSQYRANLWYNVVATRTVTITDADGNSATYNYGDGDGYTLDGGGSSDEASLSKHLAASNGESVSGLYKGFSANPPDLLGKYVNGKRHFFGGNFALIFSKPGTYKFCETLAVYGKDDEENHLTTVCAEFTVTEPVIVDENCAAWASETNYNISGIWSGTEPSSVDGYSDVIVKINNHDNSSSAWSGWQDEVTYAKPGDYVEWLHCYYPGAQKLANEKITTWETIYDGHHEHSEDDTPGGNNPNSNVVFKSQGEWKNSISIYADSDPSGGNGNIVNSSNFVLNKSGTPYFNSGNDLNGKLYVGFSDIVSYYDYFGNTLERRNDRKTPSNSYNDILRIQPQYATSHEFIETIRTDEGVPTHTSLDNEGEHPIWACQYYDCNNCCNSEGYNCSCGARSCHKDCWHGNDTIIVTDFDTSQKDDDARVIVPYNYKNRLDFKLNGGSNKEVFAGETAEVSGVQIVVGVRRNENATGSTYATRVDNARVRMLAFVVDHSEFTNYNDDWEPGGRKSNADDKCNLIDNAKQCAVLGQYEGSLNAEEENIFKEKLYTSIGTVKNDTYNVFDASAGDYYCVTMAIYPYTVANDFDTNPNGSGNWYIAKPQCRIIAKRPSFQVWGGSIYSAGGIVGSNYSDKVGLWNGTRYSIGSDGVEDNHYYVHTSGAKGYQIHDRNWPTLYGSWVEQSIIAKKKTITWLPSGAAIGYNGEINAGGKAMSGTTDAGGTWTEAGGLVGNRYCSKWVPLSIANTKCPPGESGIEPKSYYGDYKEGYKAIVEYWLEGHEDNINCTNGIDSKNCTYTTPTGKTVHYNDGIYTSSGLSSGGTWTVGKYNTVIVTNTNSTININHNIEYSSDSSYSNVTEIPKVIIYAGANGIDIGCDVTRIDAILITEGTLNTCKGAAPTNVNQEFRSTQLIINGAIIANKVELNRTYGNGVGLYSDEPAEIINYDSSILLWGQSAANASQSDTLTTVYQRELSPRY